MGRPFEKITAMRILVTGGCGFIASHLVNALVERFPDYAIVNMDRIDACSSPRNCATSAGKANYTMIRGDITNADFVRHVLETERIDTIVHAAAQTHVDNSFGNSLAFTRDNVLGTHVLLEAAKAAGTVTRFLHVSTDEVYGSCDGGRKTEDDALNPTNPYAASKAAAENIVRGYINAFSFPALIMRGNNVYGPRQFPEKLIPKLCLRLIRGDKCCLHGRGTNLRHFVHVSDVVDAVLLLLHKGVLGEVYNIGSEHEFTNLQIAEKLIGILKPGEPTEDWIEHVDDRAFNDTRYFLDYGKLRALGWSPRKDFDEGLHEVVKWYAGVSVADYWSPCAVTALLPHPKRA